MSTNNKFRNLNNPLCQHNEDNLFKREILNNYAAQILGTNYKQVNTNKFTINQKHLNIDQCHDLEQVWPKYWNVFDGSLGVYSHQKVHIDLLPGSELVHHQVYLVPHSHDKYLKMNSNTWLIGILEE